MSKDLALLLDRFVEDKDASWNHEDWTSLKSDVAEQGFSISENDLGELLEIEKEKYLASKNGESPVTESKIRAICRSFLFEHKEWNSEDFIELVSDLKKHGFVSEREITRVLSQESKNNLQRESGSASSLKLELEKKESHISELNHLMESFKQNSIRLENELEQSKKEFEKYSHLSGKKEELELKEKELEDSYKEMSSYQNNLADISKLKQDIENLKAENSRLNDLQTKQINSKDDDELQKKHLSLEKSYAFLKAEVNRLEDRNQKLSTAFEENSILKSEIKKLSDLLQKNKTEHEISQKKAESMHRIKELQKQALELKDKAIDSLNLELKKIRESRALQDETFRKRTKELDESEKSLKELGRNITKQMINLNEKENYFKNVEKDSSILKEESVKLREELEKKEKSLLEQDSLLKQKSQDLALKEKNIETLDLKHQKLHPEIMEKKKLLEVSVKDFKTIEEKLNLEKEEFEKKKSNLFEKLESFEEQEIYLMKLREHLKNKELYQEKMNRLIKRRLLIISKEKLDMNAKEGYIIKQEKKLELQLLRLAKIEEKIAEKEKKQSDVLEHIKNDKLEISQDKKKLLKSFHEVEKKEKDLNRIKYELKTKK